MRSNIESDGAPISPAPWQELIGHLGATGIVGLVGQEIAVSSVRSTGTVYARCVFHEERTASLVLWPNSGRFKCHGCGEEGDLPEFLTTLGLIATREETGEYMYSVGQTHLPEAQGKLF